MMIRRILPALALLAPAARASAAQPADLILSTNVLATYLGGRAVYQKPLP